MSLMRRGGTKMVISHRSKGCFWGLCYPQGNILSEVKDGPSELLAYMFDYDLYIELKWHSESLLTIYENEDGIEGRQRCKH